MACYFMQIPCVQSGTSIKTQAMETKPMERELKMKKMETQRSSRNFRPPGPELPARCLPDAVQRPGQRIQPELPPQATGTSANRNFRPSSALVPKTRQNTPGWSRKENDHFRNKAGSWPEVMPRPELPPMMTGTSARPELPPREAGTSACATFSPKLHVSACNLSLRPTNYK